MGAARRSGAWLVALVVVTAGCDLLFGIKDVHEVEHDVGDSAPAEGAEAATDARPDPGAVGDAGIPADAPFCAAQGDAHTWCSDFEGPLDSLGASGARWQIMPDMGRVAREAPGFASGFSARATTQPDAGLFAIAELTQSLSAVPSRLSIAFELFVVACNPRANAKVLDLEDPEGFVLYFSFSQSAWTVSATEPGLATFHARTFPTGGPPIGAWTRVSLDIVWGLPTTSFRVGVGDATLDQWNSALGVAITGPIVNLGLQASGAATDCDVRIDNFVLDFAQ
jgi:hypothetical protein